MFFQPYTISNWASLQVLLLENGFMRSISRYMDPSVLLDLTQVLILLIALVVAVIYLYLFIKKQRFFYTKRIRDLVENWISQVIMEDELASEEISRRIRRILNNTTARQFMIDELILCKKNFSGSVSEKVVQLYEQLGLKAFSLKKLKSRKWYVKTKGIQELYLMEQQSVLRTIYKNTNSNNEFVRMEAQTGVINLTGFPGLRFLDVISYPLTEWQQLKLLEQLRLHRDKADLAEKIPGWIRSSNSSVVVFALKLADEYQVFAARNEVIACIMHPDRSVRSQAIRSAIRLADEETALILLGHFTEVPFQDQLIILDALRFFATEDEKDFLLDLLDHPNDTIKLKAAVALAKTSNDGLQILENKAIVSPEPFERICMHVKSTT